MDTTGFFPFDMKITKLHKRSKLAKLGFTHKIDYEYLEEVGPLVQQMTASYGYHGLNRDWYFSRGKLPKKEFGLKPFLKRSWRIAVKNESMLTYALLIKQEQ